MSLGFQQKVIILNKILYVFSLQRLQCYWWNFVPTCIWSAFKTSPSQYTIGIPYQSSNDSCFFYSPWIITISPIFTFLVLSFWQRLCLSRSATRYSCFHLFHGFSLHHCTYLCLFVHSSESPSAVEFIVLTSLPTITLFVVNTFNWMSSTT